MLYRFNDHPIDFSQLTRLAGHCFGTNATAQGPLPGTAGKIRYAASSIHLAAGDFAANDLAVRSVHEFSGERGCKREQHRRRCRERAVDFS